MSHQLVIMDDIPRVDALALCRKLIRDGFSVTSKPRGSSGHFDIQAIKDIPDFENAGQIAHRPEDSKARAEGMEVAG